MTTMLTDVLTSRREPERTQFARNPRILPTPIVSEFLGTGWKFRRNRAAPRCSATSAKLNDEPHDA